MRRSRWVKQVMAVVVAAATMAAFAENAGAAPEAPSNLAAAMTMSPGLVVGAAYEDVAPSGTDPAAEPTAVSSHAVGSFPREGASYAVLSSGDAAAIATGGSTDNSLGGPSRDLDNNPGERNLTDLDVTVLRIDLTVPAEATCLAFDFRFYSAEYPTFVGTSFNDAFIAELDQTTWQTDGSNITAPANFAFDQNGDVISINAAGAASMSEAEAAGSPYGGATALLTAKTPITPGAHALYLSIFDQGDTALDSTVLLDALRVGTPTAPCTTGVTQSDPNEVPSIDPEPSIPPIDPEPSIPPIDPEPSIPPVGPDPTVDPNVVPPYPGFPLETVTPPVTTLPTTPPVTTPPITTPPVTTPPVTTPPVTTPPVTTPPTTTPPVTTPPTTTPPVTTPPVTTPPVTTPPASVAPSSGESPVETEVLGVVVEKPPADDPPASDPGDDAPGGGDPGANPTGGGDQEVATPQAPGEVATGDDAPSGRVNPLLAVTRGGARSGPPGTSLQVQGDDYAACDRVFVFFDGRRIGTASPRPDGTVRLTNVSAPGNAKPGNHLVTTSCEASGEQVVEEATFVVLDSSLHRTSFTTSLTRPDQMVLSAKQIAITAAITLAFLLLVAFPGDLFNSTLEENYDEVRGWFGLKEKAAKPPATGGRSILSFTLFTAAAAVLYGMLEPGFGLDGASLALTAGLMVGLSIVALALAAPELLYRRRLGDHGVLRVLPGTLLVALACVLVSRTLGFQPGYLYGALAGVAFSSMLRKESEGRLAAASGLFLLVISVVAWVGWAAVSVDAGADGAGFWIIAFEASLATTFACGLETAAFAMLPMRFMAGGRVTAWSRRAWIALFSVSLFAFIHIMVRPNAGYVSGGSNRGMLVMAIGFVAFTLMSIGFWAYFRFRGGEGGGGVEDEMQTSVAPA